MKISLLSTYNDPMIGLWATQLSKKFKIDSIIFDEKGFSKKDQIIFNERVKNKIKLIDIKKILNIPFIFVKNHSSDTCVKKVKKSKIDLLINCGTPRILKKEVIDAPTIGILNCHPGILPYYRGCTCVEWALYNKDKIGNTCHFITKEIDEGPIVFQNTLKIKGLKSYQAIRTAIYLDSIKSIIKSIKIIQTKKNLKKFNKDKGNYYKPIDEGKMKFILDYYGNEK